MKVALAVFQDRVANPQLERVDHFRMRSPSDGASYPSPSIEAA